MKGTVVVFEEVKDDHVVWSSEADIDLDFFQAVSLYSLFSFWSICRLVFTALHVMQTRSSDENSVRPSVCLSVRLSVTRVIPDKMEERSVQIFIPYKRTFSLVFWEEEWLVEGDPFYVKFWVNRPPLERNRRFSTNIARSSSAVTPSEKVQLTLIGSPLRAFQWA